MLNHSFIATTLTAALLYLPSFSYSAPVTLFGDDVSFTYDDSTLFGTASVTGNSLLFKPTDFRADSLNGQGAVNISDTLNVTVLSTTPGYTIEKVALQELGDYFLSGTDATVSANGRFEVTSKTKLDGLFNFNDAQTFNITGLNSQNTATNWDVSVMTDLSAISGWGSDTEVFAQLQNNLSATTLNLGEVAWIQKKTVGVGLVINPTPVPVPAAIWLLGTGLLGITTIARRKKS